MKKYSILTFNFGNYEVFREPEAVDENCEYVYVTDNPNLKSNIWKIIVEDKHQDKTPYYKSFYVRYHPFEYVSTDTVIVIDSSMKLKKKFDKIIEDFNTRNDDIGFLLMPFHDNKPFAEIGVWYSQLRRLSASQAGLLFNLYKHHNMENYRGGIDAGFKIVKNTEKIKELHELVWEYILFLKGDSDICRLDQVVLSLLVYKKFSDLKVMLFSRRWIQSDYICYCHHGTNRASSYYNINYNNQYFLNKPAEFYYK